MRFRDVRVGQRVIVREKWYGHTEFAGQKGTVVTVDDVDHDMSIGVEFDNAIPSFSPRVTGHDCGEHARYGHGFYGQARDIDLLPPQIEDIKVTFDDVII